MADSEKNDEPAGADVEELNCQNHMRLNEQKDCSDCSMLHL